MTKDYLIEVKVKNNQLVSRMKAAGFVTAVSLSKKAKVGLPILYSYISLRKSPVGVRGKLRLDIIRIAKVLKCDPYDLFPPQHLEKCLLTNKASFTADLSDVGDFISGNQDTAKMAIEHIVEKENAQELYSVLHVLNKREADIIERRFGLNDKPEETLEQIGKSYNISRERIRGIERAAIRKLRGEIWRNHKSLPKDANIVSAIGSHAKPNHHLPEWKKEEIKEKIKNYTVMPDFELFKKYPSNH